MVFFSLHRLPDILLRFFYECSVDIVTLLPFAHTLVNRSSLFDGPPVQSPLTLIPLGLPHFHPYALTFPLCPISPLYLSNFVAVFSRILSTNQNKYLNIGMLLSPRMA